MAMLRVGCVVVLVALTAIVAAAPRGKVVRIERPRTSAAAAPIICDVKASLSGMCVGNEPRHGDIVAVVNDQKVIAEVRILTAKTTNPQCETLWQITAELVRGDLSGTRSSTTLGVIDGGVDERVARNITDRNALQLPTNDPGTQPFAGIDRDGNGTADVVLAFVTCPGASTMGFECFEFWTRRNQTMARSYGGNLKGCSP